jgi:hypothetical protein
MEISRKETDTGSSTRLKESELPSKYRHYRRFPTKALQLLPGFLILSILLLSGCAPIQLEPAPGWTEKGLDDNGWWNQSPPSYPSPILTPEGRSLSVRAYGLGPKTVLILGGIHGSEQGSAQLVNNFEVFIRKQGVPKGLTLLFVNPANPDGLARGKRKNAHGVDLNRNFPASNFKPRPSSGKNPLSEIESRFLAKIVQGSPLTLIISVHQPRRSVNWDGPAEDLARLLASYNGYRLEASVGYPTPGSLGSWAGIDLKIPILTLELPRKPDTPEGFFANNKEGILQVLRRVASQGRGLISSPKEPR